MRAITLAFVASLLAFPAAGQNAVDRYTGDRLQQDSGNPGQLEEYGMWMNRQLPLKHGQIVHYYDDQGEYEGYARRFNRTIRFYDPDGFLAGRAERVSQSATTYYAPNGTYLGRRLHTKLTTKDRAVDPNPSARGFYFPHLEAGRDGKE
jgi:hypothetical protein